MANTTRLTLAALAAGIAAPFAFTLIARNQTSTAEARDGSTQGALVEPGGTAESARLVTQDPDEFAWQLFLFINRQAELGKAGVPDAAKRTVTDYDDNKDVVWETWALASADGLPGGSEVFLAKGAKPVAWAALPRATGAAKKLDHTFTAAGEKAMMVTPKRNLRQFHPSFSPTEPESDEVRMNESTFTFIRDNELYSREGLAAAFAKAKTANNRDFIQFNPMAKEVKATWRQIADADKPNYHWKTLNGKTYGLKAFHVITKDLPMWFWTDFIHESLEPDEPPNSTHDSTTRGPGAKHGSNGVRDETKNSKWAHYRLKGSQVSFTDSRGVPTILGNQLIEFGNAATSSCMTCHALARIDKNGNGFTSGFIIGVPPSTPFGTADIQTLQVDFLYSVTIRAHSTTEP
jgi:hypothetical protein